MEKMKVFIDGREGTTGLRIVERLTGREDVALVPIDPSLRKDPAERARCIAASDITFLCLPDAAAKEAVALAAGTNTRIIDASTAHRTEPGWAYGFPELSEAKKEAVIRGSRVAVPGCHASGFVALAAPLVAGGLLRADYPLSSFSLTGYSGGGKKMIAQYEAPERDAELDAPRAYALTEQHKHLKEMTAIPGLAAQPLFTPIVSDYYSGMLVSLPLFADQMRGDGRPVTMEEVHALYCMTYHKPGSLVRVQPLGTEAAPSGFLSGSHMAGFDDMEIYVTGNEERLLLMACFDNLGKGASGAAIQCFNLMTGQAPGTGLHLKYGQVTA